MQHIFLIFILFLCLPNITFALSDDEYRDLLATSTKFKNADAALSNHWKKIFKPLKGTQRQYLLDEQRAWIIDERDEIAMQFMEAGLSREDAYTIATLRRIRELDYLNYYAHLSQKTNAKKTIDDFLIDKDYPSYYHKQSTKPQHAPSKDLPTPKPQSAPNLTQPNSVQPSIQEPSPANNAVVKLKATVAITEANTDRSSFDRKYKNRQLLIAGIITDIRMDNTNYILTLNGSNNQEGIRCYFDEKYSDQILTLNQDDAISVKGMYKVESDSQYEGITLYNCEIEF